MEQLKDGQAKLLEQIHQLNNRNEDSTDDKLRL